MRVRYQRPQYSTGFAADTYNDKGIPTGKLQYYGYWPNKPYSSSDNTSVTREAKVADLQINNNDKDVKSFNEPGFEGRKADAILKIDTGGKEGDTKALNAVKNFIKNSQGYNAEKANCATSATVGAKATGKQVNSKDTLTPNRLGKWFLNRSGQGNRQSITVDSPVTLYNSLKGQEGVETIKKPETELRPILEGIRNE